MRIPVDRSRPALAAVFLATIAVYWRTAYPTITWWDSGSYSLVAATMGVGAPPGSLLLTLLGWPFTKLNLGMSPAHVLNLLAGVLAAVTVALVYVVAARIFRLLYAERSEKAVAFPSGAAILGIAAGTLAFAFSDTLWNHAIQFTPYVLTGVFTGLILWTMVRWWETADRPDAWRSIALLGLLFGLDFSVHRTNALLLPGALAWILIRRPRTLGEVRTVLVGAGSLAIGLAVQLLVAPIAAFTTSPWNWGAPDTWSRFWSYVSLEQRGGNFLVQFFPRKAPFLSVQVGDFLRALSDNFLDLPLLGALPAVAVVIGLVALWRRDRRFAAAFSTLIFLHAATTVLYFNIPAGYFRPFDRHYLPVFITLSVTGAFGLGAALDELSRLRSMVGRFRVPIFASVAIAMLPAALSLAGNWKQHDASRRWFARDYAANALSRLPPDAIYFTMGDNDTFPVLYLQAVEGIRPDVSIINLNMLNFPSYLDAVVRRDPSLATARRMADTYEARAQAWTDTTIVIPVAATAASLGLRDGTNVPPTIRLQAAASAGSGMLSVDLIVLDLIRANQWRRPIVFATTVGESAMGWLRPYARLDGVFWRIVPVTNPTPVIDLLRANLFANEYRGYADPSVRVEGPTLNIGMVYRSAFESLAVAEREHGSREQCRSDWPRSLALVPPERLTPARALPESPCGL